jgi:hypothetical protein
VFDHRKDQALTVISMSGDVPEAPERREDFRNLSILKAAILRTALGEELCLVRNISRAGLMAHIFSDLAVDDPVKIEFRSGAAVRGLVVWRRPDLMGVKFSQIVNVADVLSEAARPQGYVARSPRINVNAPIRLRAGVHYQAAALCNISQGGARVLLSEPAQIGEEVVLSVAGLPSLVGSVRWQRERFAGVAFHDLIAFEDVARWIANHNRSGISPASD